MVTNHIAAPQRVHPDLRIGPLTDNALAAMAQFLSERHLAHFSQNFGQRGGCAAWRISLEAMMHLDNLEVEVGSQHLGRFSRKPKQGVHPGGIIGRPHDRNL